MSKKPIKYSANFERDWQFYVANFDKFSFWGGDAIFEPIDDPNGISAKEFFYKLDSTGMKKMATMPCRESEVVSTILRFKKALNFHIKMWVEGYEDCGMGIHEYLEMFDNPPEWVETSFRNQLTKLYKSKLPQPDDVPAKPDCV